MAMNLSTARGAKRSKAVAVQVCRFHLVARMFDGVVVDGGGFLALMWWHHSSTACKSDSRAAAMMLQGNSSN